MMVLLIKMIKKMVMEHKLGQMGINMKENGKMIKDMDMEQRLMQMGINMKENGKMIINMVMGH